MTEQEQAELLRRYEPIIKYTRGEQFFPMDAEAYIRCCSLWIKRPTEEPRQLIAPGQLTPDLLAEPYQDDVGTVRYLQFTEPLKATEMAAKALRRRRSEQHDVAVFNPAVLSNPRLECQLTYRLEGERISVEMQPGAVWISLEVHRL